MKKIFVVLALAAIWMFALPSCSKKKGCMDKNSISYDKDAEEDDGSCQYAGIGGNTTIVARPLHHDSVVVSAFGHHDSAFVKFNTQEFPGSSPSSYDLIQVGDSGEDHVHLHNLKVGKYYIYMTGYDTLRHLYVRGGIPYILTQAAGEVDLVVPVSED
jgi:hypothetical protein